MSIVCLGTMMFGDRTGAARGERDRRRMRSTPASTSSTPRTSTSNGASETITGAAIRAQRARWILATKVGNVIGGDENRRPYTGGSSRRWIFAGVRREPRAPSAPTGSTSITCIVDDPETPLEETVAAMGALIDAGKIRYFGISNFRGWRIAEADALLRAAGRRAAGRLPAVLQPAEPDARSRGARRLRSLRHRRRVVFADRARRADRASTRRAPCPRIRALRATTGG